MKKTLSIVLIIGSLVGCQKNAPDEPLPMPVFTGVLKNIKASHPRLMLSDARVEELNSLRKSDATLERYVQNVITTANGILTKTALQRVLIGPRLLDVSRELLHRTTHLALAYRLTGDKRYLDVAVSNMKTVCAFSDWNPSHFLDVAEMTNGVALGYDWLYKDLSTEDRETIRQGIVTKGLAEYRKGYSQTAWWTKADNNWNQVCSGGLIVGALAVAETDPDYARDLIPKALTNLPLSNKYYAPDGAWYEGPGYWSYATEYLSYGMAALQSAVGNMADLEKTEGLEKSGVVPMICAGPTNFILNFADSGENSRATNSAAMFFLANVYGQNAVANYLHNLIKTTNATARPFHVLWYRPATTQTDNRPLDYFLRGDFNELVLMRSSWTDPNALWVGVKSGVNSSNHSHLDLGNFELDAGGVRWARDFGVDDYNLPGYWSMGVNGQRWSYYRLNSFSHNICVLGNKNQYEIAMARFTQTDLNTTIPSATIDLTQAYDAFSSKSSRKVSMIEGRKAVQIEDNFSLTKPTEVAWGMTTAQIIDIKKGGKATLRNAAGTRSLEVEILAPVGAEFSEESAERKAPEKLNTGNRRLMIRLPNQTGTVKIVVKFTPK